MALCIERARDQDTDALLALLRSNGLPTEGLLEHLGTAFVARDGSTILGSAALEIYPDGALLRSVAVATAWRGQGVGRDLTAAALGLARELRLPAVYLLTTTAERYFLTWRFAPITRAEVPATVQQSIEFLSACPSTATVMRKTL